MSENEIPKRQEDNTGDSQSFQPAVEQAYELLKQGGSALWDYLKNSSITDQTNQTTGANSDATHQTTGDNNNNSGDGESGKKEAGKGETAEDDQIEIPTLKALEAGKSAEGDRAADIALAEKSPAMHIAHDQLGEPPASEADRPENLANQEKPVIQMTGENTFDRVTTYTNPKTGDVTTHVSHEEFVLDADGKRVIDKDGVAKVRMSGETQTVTAKGETEPKFKSDTKYTYDENDNVLTAKQETFKANSDGKLVKDKSFDITNEYGTSGPQKGQLVGHHTELRDGAGKVIDALDATYTYKNSGKRETETLVHTTHDKDNKEHKWTESKRHNYHLYDRKNPETGEIEAVEKKINSLTKIYDGDASEDKGAKPLYMIKTHYARVGENGKRDLATPEETLQHGGKLLNEEVTAWKMSGGSREEVHNSSTHFDVEGFVTKSESTDTRHHEDGTYHVTKTNFDMNAGTTSVREEFDKNHKVTETETLKQNAADGTWTDAEGKTVLSAESARIISDSAELGEHTDDAHRRSAELSELQLFAGAGKEKGLPSSDILAALPCGDLISSFDNMSDFGGTADQAVQELVEMGGAKGFDGGSDILYGIGNGSRATGVDNYLKLGGTTHTTAEAMADAGTSGITAMVKSWLGDYKGAAESASAAQTAANEIVDPKAALRLRAKESFRAMGESGAEAEHNIREIGGNDGTRGVEILAANGDALKTIKVLEQWSPDGKAVQGFSNKVTICDGNMCKMYQFDQATREFKNADGSKALLSEEEANAALLLFGGNGDGTSSGLTAATQLRRLGNSEELPQRFMSVGTQEITDEKGVVQGMTQSVVRGATEIARLGTVEVDGKQVINGKVAVDTIEVMSPHKVDEVTGKPVIDEVTGRPAVDMAVGFNNFKEAGAVAVVAPTGEISYTHDAARSTNNLLAAGADNQGVPANSPLAKLAADMGYGTDKPMPAGVAGAFTGLALTVQNGEAKPEQMAAAWQDAGDMRAVAARMVADAQATGVPITPETARIDYVKQATENMRLISSPDGTVAQGNALSGANMLITPIQRADGSTYRLSDDGSASTALANIRRADLPYTPGGTSAGDSQSASAATSTSGNEFRTVSGGIQQIQQFYDRAPSPEGATTIQAHSFAETAGNVALMSNDKTSFTQGMENTIGLSNNNTFAGGLNTLNVIGGGEVGASYRPEAGTHYTAGIEQMRTAATQNTGGDVQQMVQVTRAAGGTSQDPLVGAQAIMAYRHDPDAPAPQGQKQENAFSQGASQLRADLGTATIAASDVRSAVQLATPTISANHPEQALQDGMAKVNRLADQGRSEGYGTTGADVIHNLSQPANAQAAATITAAPRSEVVQAASHFDPKTIYTATLPRNSEGQPVSPGEVVAPLKTPTTGAASDSALVKQQPTAPAADSTAAKLERAIAAAVPGFALPAQVADVVNKAFPSRETDKDDLKDPISRMLYAATTITSGDASSHVADRPSLAMPNFGSTMSGAAALAARALAEPIGRALPLPGLPGLTLYDAARTAERIAHETARAASAAAQALSLPVRRELADVPGQLHTAAMSTRQVIDAVRNTSLVNNPSFQNWVAALAPHRLGESAAQTAVQGLRGVFGAGQSAESNHRSMAIALPTTPQNAVKGDGGVKVSSHISSNGTGAVGISIATMVAKPGDGTRVTLAPGNPAALAASLEGSKPSTSTSGPKGSRDGHAGRMDPTTFRLVGSFDGKKSSTLKPKGLQGPLKVQGRALTGAEIALAIMLVSAAASRSREVKEQILADGLPMNASEAYAKDGAELYADDIKTYDDSIIARPTWLVRHGEDLVKLAEHLFHERELGWLIADLNQSSVKETFIDGKRIIELKVRQRIELPVWQDIVRFHKVMPKDASPERLVTIVHENEVDTELMNQTLGQAMGVPTLSPALAAHNSPQPAAGMAAQSALAKAVEAPEVKQSLAQPILSAAHEAALKLRKKAHKALRASDSDQDPTAGATAEDTEAQLKPKYS